MKAIIDLLIILAFWGLFYHIAGLYLLTEAERDIFAWGVIGGILGGAVLNAIRWAILKEKV